MMLSISVVPYTIGNARAQQFHVPALPLGLVDVKVCAVDETWSGLKLVIRKASRRT